MRNEKDPARPECKAGAKHSLFQFNGATIPIFMRPARMYSAVFCSKITAIISAGHSRRDAGASRNAAPEVAVTNGYIRASLSGDVMMTNLNFVGREGWRSTGDPGRDR